MPNKKQHKKRLCDSFNYPVTSVACVICNTIKKLSFFSCGRKKTKDRKRLTGENYQFLTFNNTVDFILITYIQSNMLVWLLKTCHKFLALKNPRSIEQEVQQQHGLQGKVTEKLSKSKYQRILAHFSWVHTLSLKQINDMHMQSGSFQIWSFFFFINPAHC